MEVFSWETACLLVDAGAGEDQWVGSQGMYLTLAATEECVLVEEAGGEG